MDRNRKERKETITAKDIMEAWQALEPADRKKVFVLTRRAFEKSIRAGKMSVKALKELKRIRDEVINGDIKMKTSYISEEDMIRYAKSLELVSVKGVRWTYLIMLILLTIPERRYVSARHISERIVELFEEDLPKGLNIHRIMIQVRGNLQRLAVLDEIDKFQFSSIKRDSKAEHDRACIKWCREKGFGVMMPVGERSIQSVVRANERTHEKISHILFGHGLIK